MREKLICNRVLCNCYEEYGECLLMSKCTSDERYAAFQLKCQSEGCKASQCNVGLVSGAAMMECCIWTAIVLIFVIYV
jgi:hypothetical protein